MTNHKEHRQFSEPIKIRCKAREKRVLVSHDWFDLKTDGIKDGANYVSQTLNVVMQKFITFDSQLRIAPPTRFCLVSVPFTPSRFSTLKMPQVGRGLFCIRLLILHFKFQFSKSIKFSMFHIFLNLTYSLRKISLSQNVQKSPKYLHKTAKRWLWL